MPDGINCSLKIFADDTKVYSKIESNQDVCLLQESINKLTNWTDDWLLKFNNQKCCIMHIGKNNKKYTYYMRDGNITSCLHETVSEKDLGVVIDPLLKFDEHITTIVNKARRMSFLIIRTITFKSKDIMVPLFRALIRPLLEYCNPVWNPYFRKLVELLEDIQRHYTRCIIGMKKLSYFQN